MTAVDSSASPKVAGHAGNAASGIRNVALVGHNGSGKTTLAEALLFATGAITRQGKVDDGSTVCDFEPEEIKRHMSLSLAMAPCVLGDVKLNIIDTPGYADFFGEVRAALLGRRPGGRRGERGGGHRGPDRGRLGPRRRARACPGWSSSTSSTASGPASTAPSSELQERFGAGIAPLELPVGEEAGFRGIADLLTDTAIIYENGKPQTGPIPDDLAAIEHEVREQLVEGIVVGDDDLMERYLEGEAPSGAELEATLAHGVAQGLVFPVVCGSAVTGVGHRPPGHPAGRDRPQPRLAAPGGGPGRRLGPARWRAIPAASPSPRCSRPSPTPTWARSRSCGCCRGRSGPTPCSPTPAPTPTSGSTSCSCCGARRPSPSTRPRPATSWPCPSSPTPPPATPWRPRAPPWWCPRAPPEPRASCRSPSGPSPRATRTSS